MSLNVRQNPGDDSSFADIDSLQLNGFSPAKQDSARLDFWIFLERYGTSYMSTDSVYRVLYLFTQRIR
jgi:hypothetical protein